jgi:hypothetical protein
MTTTTKTKKTKKTQLKVANVAQEKTFSQEDIDTLDTLTNEIKTAQRSFLIIADNVLKMDVDGLWAARKHPQRNERYKSIAEYCEVNFQFSASETSRYIAGGKVLKALRVAKVSEESLPTNESQTRALWRAYKAAAKEAQDEAQKAKKSKEDQRKASHAAGEEKLVSFWAKASEEGRTTAEGIDEMGGKTTVGDGRKGTVLPQTKMPIEIVVSRTTKKDADSLSTDIGLKYKQGAGMFRFATKDRSNFELLLNKVNDWFNTSGHRTIDIHLSK